MPDQITTKPFVSQAQAGWAFATRQPWAKRWARETGPYKKLPKVKRKAYTLADLEQAALKDHDPARAAQIASTLSLKGTQLAPGVTRIHGDLCNVHGRWGSCRAAGFGGADSPRVAPKQLPKAPKGKKGGKGRAPAKTEAQKRQEQETKRQERAQARQAEREQNRADTLRKLGIAPDGQAALEALQRGEQPDAAAVERGGFLKAGLVEQAADGSYRLTGSGRATLSAADAGDAGRAGSTISGARDRTSARQTRQEAAAQRKRDADAKRAAAKPKGGGGKGKKAPPAPRLPRRASGLPAARRPGSAGSGGGSAGPSKQDAPLPPAVTDAARALSEGQPLDDTQAELLIRNGLARRNRDGVLVLTGAGQRAIKTKAYTPTRTTDAGHTGVMVALFPDTAAAKAIAGADGVTEPQEQLHLTLCFLGDSTEQPLATNKEKVIAAVADWAQQHGQPLKGVVNGLGRFFHSESDDTNAVYVSPDVPGLPELRQSLVEAIEQSGFDYSHDHGFTPHITVAYVPLNAPTPPIRVETPIVFDHATLAWGDEHYDFPLGIAAEKDYPDQTQYAGYTMEDWDDTQPDSFYHAKSFAVFKDTSGAWRWVSRTTTAFEDRDGEVLSTKALADSAASNAARGPLRFWHMGRPDPLSTDRPWGPGVDLGWCDFAALSGRTLIESGTFKSAAIAEAVAAKADQLELSPGFFHAAGEPDASGVFHHIRVFERSLVPKWAGRASNRYTGLVVEKTMDPKKVEALQTLGLSEAAIKELLAEVATTEKAAEADGVRYKAEPAAPSFLERLKAFLGAEQVEAAIEAPAAPAPAPEPVQPTVVNNFVPGTEAIAELTATVKALQAEVAALKAGPPAPEEAAVETQADMPMEEETTEITDNTGGEMSWDDVLTGFGALLDAKLGPLVEALGITSKLDGHMGELKSLLGGYVKQKDDRDAQLRATVDQHDAQLRELVEDKPRGGYRPTQAGDNTLLTIKETPDGRPLPTLDNPFADLIAQLIPGAQQQ